ncbi:MAG TPA: lipopolysaccharide heptosyltransferase I [Tepidisphaeraceae bacterium]|jgi:lipopolysaccharide heptosyltransferase I
MNSSMPANFSPQRILIIKPSAIGDVVHTLPVLSLVRRRWPAARIAWLVTPACSGLLEGHPMLDEVILFDRKRLGGMWRSPRVFGEWRRFTKGLRERRFDLVIDLQGLFRSGWLARKTGAAVRVGFANARELAWLFYTHRVPIETMEQHAIERYLKLARFIGCDETSVEFPFATTQEDREHVRDLLIRSGLRTQHSGLEPYAVLLPGTNWETKRWPVEKFAGLTGPLRERFGVASVLAGGPDAGAMASRIPGAIDLTCKTTLKQLTALLEGASLVVANDSGPMHIAAALGRPLVTPFGPTNPVRTGPFRRMESVIRLGIECSPCYSRHCSHQSCLRRLEVEPVVELAARQMGVRVQVSIGEPARR